MVLLWPIYAKIELICQQPTMPKLSGAHLSFVGHREWLGGSRGGLAMMVQYLLGNGIVQWYRVRVQCLFWLVDISDIAQSTSEVLQ